MKRNHKFPTLFNLFILSCMSLLFFLPGCRPRTAFQEPIDFPEADTVYYEDLIAFVSEDDSPGEIAVCEFGREKIDNSNTGSFWGCILTEGRWSKLRKTGQYRLLSSEPSILEGPPGVRIVDNYSSMEISYTDADSKFRLTADKLSFEYKAADNNAIAEYYGFGKGALEVGGIKFKGKTWRVLIRRVGYTPITSKYKNEYQNFNRFLLFDNDALIVVKDNETDMGYFASLYDLPATPPRVCAFVKAGRTENRYDTFKMIITDKTYDLALFRIPYGWEIQFDRRNSVVLAGQGYYLDNKIFSGRAIIAVTGALNSNGKDYEVKGICEFIK
jgi:hypothetical protein